MGGRHARHDLVAAGCLASAVLLVGGCGRLAASLAAPLSGDPSQPDCAFALGTARWTDTL
jgi:hypothetical protein